MKTIEERALEKYPVCMHYNDYAMEETDINEFARLQYIEAVEEQKKIDDEDWELRLKGYLNKQENELIEKAREWAKLVANNIWEDTDNEGIYDMQPREEFIESYADAIEKFMEQKETYVAPDTEVIEIKTEGTINTPSITNFDERNEPMEE